MKNTGQQKAKERMLDEQREVQKYSPMILVVTIRI